MKNLAKVISLFCILVILWTCKKEEIPTLTTTQATDISGTSASSGGIILNDGHSKVIIRGVCWSTKSKPTISDSKTSDGSGSGNFLSSITSLTMGTTYYLRAYATNNVGTGYGNELVISTTGLPSAITTSVIIDLTSSTASSGGTISSDGGTSITARGVCWNTSPDPTIDNLKTLDGTGSGNFTSSITNLYCGTTYYLRAYATNNNGTIYGNTLTFITITPSTNSNFKPTGLIPATESQLFSIPTIESLDTSSVPNLRSVKSLPFSTIIDVPNPGSQGSQNSCVGWAVGYGMLGYTYRVFEGHNNFIGDDRNFSPNYIWNQLNLGLNINTSVPVALLLVQLEGCSKLSDMPLTSGVKDKPSSAARISAANYKISAFYRFGSVDLNKMKTYLSKNYPLIVGLKIDDEFQITGGNQFEKQLDGRLVWKKYTDKNRYNHVLLICGYDDAINAFKVVNSWSDSWGDKGYFWIDYDFFKTSVINFFGPEIYIAWVRRPILSTKSITEITSTSAKCGGLIFDDWKDPVMQKGVCWSTTEDPTINNNKTEEGAGTENFISTLSGLLPSTKYYVKAYAINSQGIAYGYQVNFTTPVPVNNPPAIPSTPNPNNGETSVSTIPTLTWTCTDPESDPMTFDVYIGSTSNPTTLVGSNLTTMSYSPSVLNSGTLYYWKVVAKDNNSNSTPSPIWNFTTQNNGGSGIIFNPNLTYGSITDIDGNIYKTIQIGTQTWMAENLKATHYNDNTAIPPVNTNTAWAALITPGYCWYLDDIANKNLYGALYNWYAVSVTTNGGRNVCPTGWHVPTDIEWSTLTTFLWGESVAGGKLKETGTTHYISPNAGATNETGFTSLPGGHRNTAGTTYNAGSTCYLWSSTGSTATTSFSRYTDYSTNMVHRYSDNNKNGFSIRCIKD